MKMQANADIFMQRCRMEQENAVPLHGYDDLFNLCFTLHSPCSRLEEFIFEARHSLTNRCIIRTLCAGSRQMNVMEDMKVDIESRPLQELTLGELLPYFRKMITEEIDARGREIPLQYSGMEGEITEMILKDPARFTYGMDGMADTLHCSVRTAYKLKRTGDFNGAIFKFGGRYVIDRVRVLEIAQKRSQITNTRQQI